MAKGFCSICRRATRGGYAAHAATASHKTASRRADTAKRGKSVERSSGAAARGRAARAARKNQDKYLASEMVRITHHKRSRPNDGPARTVAVVRHYRHRPARGYVAPWSKGGDWW